MCTLTCTHTHMHMHTNTCTGMRMHMHMHTHTHTQCKCMHTSTRHTHVHMHKHRILIMFPICPLGEKCELVNYVVLDPQWLIRASKILFSLMLPGCVCYFLCFLMGVVYRHMCT